MKFLQKYSFILVLAVFASSGCGILQRNKTAVPAVAEAPIDTAYVESPADTAFASSSIVPPAVKPVAGFLADTLNKADEGKKKKKKKKRVFMGYKTKKGHVKIGRGKNPTIEVFYYLKEFKQPPAHATEKYYFDFKKRRVYKTSGDLEEGKVGILHGPYKKTIGKQVIEQGFFYMGTKHLRWEKYNRKNVLLDKEHYDRGLPSNSIVTYYDAGQTKVKEVIPYKDGNINGEYRSYYENGQPHWRGEVQNGKKIGVWTQFYDFRGRRHYEFQYPESAYDEPFEPYLIRQYNRHGKLIYEKDKVDLRTTASEGQ